MMPLGPSGALSGSDERVLGDPRPVRAETEPLAALLERAGLVEAHTAEDGRVVYRHTAQGDRIWRMLAMSDREHAQAVLDDLLDHVVAASDPRPTVRLRGTVGPG
jgi:hypothetical protein